ncbi:hypothetical protein LRS05_06545 [Flavobacterium sp. J372]|uniref:hypothetical protein n=1 Tax=Flavobacterium sp. J372 TaxID=2898436 RepID=UPI002151507D|nr:hypothetical protein [Flavobacterium sp. J372]MCR5861817.1 hypothetical protein [Flavobacterium sp. J372]
MGEIKKHGLLGFHFVFNSQHRAYLYKLVSKFEISDIVKDHSLAISDGEYITLKTNGAFASLTTYYKLEPFRFLISELRSGSAEAWFGFYPEEDISVHKNLLTDLLAKCRYCICGFEIEISDYDKPELHNSQSANYVITKGKVSKSSSTDAEEEKLISHYFDILLSFGKKL